MDLKRAIAEANDGQREAIRCFSGPLDISAGAGTGKTHTLTWRLVNALVSTDAGTPEDISEVLVITFTNKAAAELVSRVRAALKDVGRFDDALAIDDAWISTIHAMCSRILREHALEAGVDPFFTEILGDDVTLLEELAYEETLAWAREDGRFIPVLDDCPPEELFDSIDRLRKKIAVLPDAAEHICTGPEGTSMEAVLDTFIEQTADQNADYGELAGSDETAAEAYNATGQTLEDLRKFKQDMVGRSDEEFIESFLEMLGRIPSTPARKKAIKPIAYAEREARASAATEIAYAYAAMIDRLEVELAFRYQDAYRALKDERNVLDMDDLLIRAYELLKEHPEVAAGYRERFKLVMIDECQDTDQLQIDILASICGDNLATLCVVGDEQQSIYRFRGADVAVYRALKDRVAGLSSGRDPISLKTNYRSHSDILSAVNTLFRQKNVFGERCLELEPGPPEHSKANRDLGSEPRVRICHCEGGGGGMTEKRVFQAEYIAVTFERLMKEHPDLEPDDFAILLGNMTSVDIYTKALARHGIESITSGGSGFFSYAEVSILIDYLALLCNPHDENAFVKVMSSQLFDLHDDDLLELKRLKGVIAQEDREAGGKGNRTRKTSLFDALGRARGTRLEQAYARLSLSLEEASLGEIARALTETFTGSTWEAYLLSRATHTRAVVANLVRFLDLVRAAEEMPGSNIASVANQFARARENKDNQPAGVLISGDRNAVTIMTIHKSKGLEFPIVAVAELFDSDGFRDDHAFYSARTGEDFHVAFKPGGEWLSRVAGKDVRNLVSADRKDDGEERWLGDVRVDESTPKSHTMSLLEYERCAAREERQRLFYVACTRAIEVLMLFPACKDRRLSADKLTNRPALASLAGAFFEGGDLPVARRQRFKLTPDADAFGGLYEHYGFERGPDGIRFRIESTSEEIPAEAVTVSAEMLDSLMGAVSEEGEKTSQTFDGGRVYPPVKLSPAWIDRRRYSYSSLAAQATHHVDYPDEEEQATPPDDKDRIPADDPAGEDVDVVEVPANDFGSAFHLAAQMMADAHSLELPGDGRIDSLCRQFELDVEHRKRLLEALDRWSGSDIAARAFSYPQVIAEQPFNVAIPLGDAGGEDGRNEADEGEGDTSEGGGISGGKFALEGSIDLYCRDPEDEKVLIVDYKTGTSEGLPEEGGLAGRYELQARCYAYAARRAGAAMVEVVYVRPEVDAAGQPEEIRPCVPDDARVLEEDIRNTYLRTKAAQRRSREV